MKKFNPNAYGNPRIKPAISTPPALSTHVSQTSIGPKGVTSPSLQQTHEQLRVENVIPTKGNTPSSKFVVQKNDAHREPAGGLQNGLQNSQFVTKAANTIRKTARKASEVRENPVNKKPKAEVTDTAAVKTSGLDNTQPRPTNVAPATAQYEKKIVQHALPENLPRPLQGGLPDQSSRPIVSTPYTPPKHTPAEISCYHSPVHVGVNEVQSKQPEAVSSRGIQSLSTEEKLSRARNMKLKGISLRNKGKDKTATTSLGDLAIARQVSSANLRPNPNDSPAPQLCTSSQVRLNIDASFIKHGPRKEISRVSPQTPRADLESIAVTPESNLRFPPLSKQEDQHSNSSMLPLRSRSPFVLGASGNPHPLLGWDNKLQPPPPDWNDRPRFDHDSPALRNDFERWKRAVIEKTRSSADALFAAIPPTKLQDMSLTPDGVSMVAKTTTISRHNAERYGYNSTDAEEVLKYATVVNRRDYEDWGKLDMSKPENYAYGNETTNDLVRNWNERKEAHLRLIDAQTQFEEHSVQQLFEHSATPNPNTPILNIYLRPAIKADVSQMAKIYNWYVKHSPRTAEIYPIADEEMEDRLEDVRSSKLPFLVAIEPNSHNTTSLDMDDEAEAAAMRNNPDHIRNIDPFYKPVTGGEKVVGWACAEDFTAADYAERLSTELAIFVDPAYRQLGIGRCLLDKILESCDRGYLKRGGYQFSCPLEMRHLYSDGGGRDLHKLLIILRKWKYPKKSSTPTTPVKYPTANLKRKLDDQEDEYDSWLRAWLEAWNFEVEGVLKGIGAKNGRFIDQVFLTRETRWQPTEGKIPDPLPRQ